MHTIVKKLLASIILFVGVFGFFALSIHTAHAQNATLTTFPTIEQFTAGAPSPGEGGGVWSWIKEVVGDLFSNAAGLVLRPLVWAFQKLGSIALYFGGWFLGAAIDISLGQPLNQFNGIQIGWQVMRDFANLFFIFVILYIAIQTILQMSDRSTKQMLVRVIVVALLINFSSFFTKVVIDAGNIVAVGFYNRILTSNAPNSASPYCPPTSTTPCSISDRFNSALSINNLTNKSTMTAADGTTIDLGELQKSMIYFFIGIVLFVLSSVFIRGGYYFIARTVAFAFLIVFSPIAFLAYAVPNSHASKFLSAWWGKLLNYTLLAPIYMIILYLILQIITQGGLDAQGGVFNLMNFIIIIGLLSAGSTMAFSFADSTGSAVANWASKVTTGAAVGAMTGAAAYGARQTVGRFAARQADNEQLKADAQKSGLRGSFARFRLGAYEKGAKGSWDVSQSKAGSAALGSKAMNASVPGFMQKQGGFSKSGGIEHQLGNRGKLTKTQEEDYAKKAKELFPDDPIAQQNYLQNNMGAKRQKDAAGNVVRDSNGKTLLENNFDTTKNKEAREIARKGSEKQRTKANSADIETKAAALKNTKDPVAKEALEKEIRTLMQQIGPKAVAELKETTLREVATMLNSAQINAIHEADAAGNFRDSTLLSDIGTSIMGAKYTNKAYNDTLEKSKEHLTSPEGQQKLFNYRVPESQKTQTMKYKSAVQNTANVSSRGNSEIIAAFDQVKQVTAAHGKQAQSIADDLAQLTKDMDDIIIENKGEKTWGDDDIKRLRELADKTRSKRRELETILEKHTTSTTSSSNNAQLNTLRQEYNDLQRSSALPDIARRNDLKRQIDALTP